MTRNAPSRPVLVRHVCEVHGERLLAPVTSTVSCKCGQLCSVDVAGWVATTLDHYPDRDLRELAGMASIPFEKVQEVLNNRQGES
jgi:hypothetical protein